MLQQPAQTSLCVSQDKPVQEESEGPGSPPPYKMIQTIGLSVGAAVAYIIAVLGLMFYCKKRCKAKRLQKQPEGEEPEMECLNGEPPPSTTTPGGRWCRVQVLSALWWPWWAELQHWRMQAATGASHPSWKPGVGPFPGPGLLRNLA